MIHPAGFTGLEEHRPPGLCGAQARTPAFRFSVFLTHLEFASFGASRGAGDTS